MRAGPLSSPETIKILNENYVCAWVLTRDLKESRKVPDTELAQWATRALEHYKYPVDSMIFAPDLAFLDNLGTNNLLLGTPRAQWNDVYAGFLKRNVENRMKK